MSSSLCYFPLQADQLMPRSISPHLGCREPPPEYTPSNTRTLIHGTDFLLSSPRVRKYAVFFNDALSNTSSPGKSDVVCFLKVSGTCCLSSRKWEWKCHQVGHCVCSKLFRKRIWNALGVVRGHYTFNLGLLHFPPRTKKIFLVKALANTYFTWNVI